MENRILVVDDEKEIRAFLYKALTRLGGFHVELAETGEEALQKIEKETFDLIMTDLKMPKMDGLQLITKIAKSKPEILTVLMTDQELRRVDAMKSEFVSVASHELRTPLAAIKNAVQLMLSGKTGEINENQAKFLSMAERNINRLTNILNDLLNLSRIESGKIELKFENIALKEIIELSASSLRPHADVKSIQIEVEIPKSLPAIYGDQEKIEQILTNLIGNAIKFTPDGGEILISGGPFSHDPKE